MKFGLAARPSINKPTLRMLPGRHESLEGHKLLNKGAAAYFVATVHIVSITLFSNCPNNPPYLGY